MTRILVQRGSGGSSSGSTRNSQLSSNQSTSSSREEEQTAVSLNDSPPEIDDSFAESGPGVIVDEIGRETAPGEEKSSIEEPINELAIQEHGPFLVVSGASCPPPPPVPPPKPSKSGLTPRRTSPRSFNEAEGYNSADEQNPCFGPSFDDAERERHFELDIRRSKGYEVKRMLEDGNCLFRAVADQVYGDPEAFDMVRQMCIDYMERERDHFSQFVTESFMSYCKRKRRDKVYGNNLEIQALSEMYNRPIHIYSYSTEPINIFHGGYGTDTPPIRLSYHRGNHYNSLIDPRILTVGAGLGFSSLRGMNIDKDKVKAAIKAQQDQQIDSALLAEGRFYSDLELTEKEIERTVMEASRAEYLSKDTKLKKQMGFCGTTPGAEPSSSATTKIAGTDIVSNNCVRTLLSMGFGYLQVMDAYSIFGDDVDSILCYLLETDGAGGTSIGKGKAAE
ncbi:OTU-like cysteine protease family protein isoform X2 [Wolffia australiana]